MRSCCCCNWRLALRRREVRDRGRAPVLPTTPAIDARIRRLFPFALTADQDRAVADICRDLASDRPMQRLLQADVGAGKTAVAVYALLVAVANKHQAALMAPTEVLARQHCRTLDRYLAHSRVRRLLLTGGLTPKRTAAGAGGAAGGRDRSGGRHAGAGAGGRAVRPAGAGGDRRAAQVRRPPAGALPQAGRRSALSGDDGDADSAHGGPDRLRRPGRVGDARAAAGPQAGGHALGGGRTSASASTSSCARA